MEIPSLRQLSARVIAKKFIGEKTPRVDIDKFLLRLPIAVRACVNYALLDERDARQAKKKVDNLVIMAVAINMLLIENGVPLLRYNN
jgi:hypothetical protein